MYCATIYKNIEHNGDDEPYDHKISILQENQEDVLVLIWKMFGEVR